MSAFTASGRADSRRTSPRVAATVGWATGIAETLALFRSLDPRLKRIVMSHAVRVLAETDDIKAAVQMLIRQTAVKAQKDLPL